MTRSRLYGQRTIMALLSALLFASVPAFAQNASSSTTDTRSNTSLAAPSATDTTSSPKQGDTGGPPPESGPDGPNDHFMRSDANHDGFVSKDEMEAEHKKRFDEMFALADANKDGKLSPEEMKAGREALRNKFRERMQNRGGGENGAGDAGEGNGKRGEMFKNFRERRQQQGQ